MMVGFYLLKTFFKLILKGWLLDITENIWKIEKCPVINIGIKLDTSSPAVALAITRITRQRQKSKISDVRKPRTIQN